jgi:hypothetical protein
VLRVHKITAIPNIPPLPPLPLPKHTLYIRITLAGADELSAFECVMSVLLNWCGTWAETFPYPPLLDLGVVEELLRHHDPQLAHHLGLCGAGPEVYAWPLMRTALSEVLTREEVGASWPNIAQHALSVMDVRLFVYNKNPNNSIGLGGGEERENCRKLLICLGLVLR